MALFLGLLPARYFYVATAVNITRFRLAAYFMTSFIVGVLGSGLVVRSWLSGRIQ